MLDLLYPAELSYDGTVAYSSVAGHRRNVSLVPYNILCCARLTDDSWSFTVVYLLYPRLLRRDRRTTPNYYRKRHLAIVFDRFL